MRRTFEDKTTCLVRCIFCVYKIQIGKKFYVG